MRALWDVHTDGGSPPNFTQIAQWADSANPWGDLEAFEELDAEADQIGGELDANWDVAASLNGIDWPSGGGGDPIFSDDFESGDASAWSVMVP